MRLLSADGDGRLPSLWRGLEGHRRQPWPSLSEEPARRGDGHAERRSCAKVLPHSQREGMGLTITLADITEEEFRVLELIEAERQEQIKGGHAGAQGS